MKEHLAVQALHRKEDSRSMSTALIVLLLLHMSSWYLIAAATPPTTAAPLVKYAGIKRVKQLNRYLILPL